MRSFLGISAAALLIGSLALAKPSVSAVPTVRLDVASTFPGSLPLLGSGARTLMERIERASDGTLSLMLHEPGTLVPAAETVKAVADGRVLAAWAGAGWLAKDDSAFNLFSTVPFGPAIGEYLAWMYHGGGLELSRELFHARGVHNIPCGLIPPEASGWFKKEIRSVDDLRGLRMRFFGLGAKVMQRLGVETRQLAPGEILGALQDGSIDATEFSLPSLDEPLGFDRITRYYYFPGWHQQATFFDLYVNLDTWNGLASHHQALLELACGDNMREMIAAGEANQGQALTELQARGVVLKRWPPEILVALETAWKELVTEESDANPSFARVYASYAAFRERYAIWRFMSHL